MIPAIVECRPVDRYRVWIRFQDGRAGEVNLLHLAGKGVFSAWDAPGGFESVYVDCESGTIAWPGGIDLDPCVMYERLAAATPPLPSVRAGG